MAAVRRFEFDASLAPYDLRAYAQWRQLSGHITPGAARLLLLLALCVRQCHCAQAWLR